MRKKELLTICCLQATRKMLKFAKKEEKRYRKQRVQKKMQQFDREVYVRICKKGEILAVSFFRVKEMLDKQIQPELVVFLNKKECTYLSYIPREAKWRTATIMNIIGYSHWNFYHCTKRDWALFRKYFDTECSRWTPLKVSAIRSIIQEFQTDILWDKIEERRRQETDEWDQVMSQIPALPKDWERWCRKSVITQHYIFYKPERKGEGYCSRCNTRVQGISPKHNQYGICPKCRQRIQYKSMKMQKRIIPKAEHTYLLQKFGVDQWYFDRISRKASYIVFLRRQENLEKEFYTMEIEPDGNIVQKSKDYNRTGEDYEAAEPFLKKWKKNVLKKIRNQEKDPTKTQVTLWTAELSAAYKDHVVMRGGKYQGQYLSDVLKAEQEAAA